MVPMTTTYLNLRLILKLYRLSYAHGKVTPRTLRPVKACLVVHLPHVHIHVDAVALAKHPASIAE